MVRKSFLVVALIVSVLFLLTSEAVACECRGGDRTASASNAFEKAETVIIGTVVDITQPSPQRQDFDDQNVSIRAETVYKGKERAGVILHFGQGQKTDCLWYFSKQMIGKRFLLYLSKPTKARPYRTTPEIEASDAPAKYYVSTCGRSEAIEKAADDLEWLNQVKSKNSK